MPNKKTIRQVGVKFDITEYQRIADLAKAQERPVGPMIRLLVREALNARGVK